MPPEVSSLSEMGFKPRVLHCFQVAGIDSLEVLLRHDERTLLRFPNFGRRSQFEVREILAKYGLKLSGNPDPYIMFQSKRVEPVSLDDSVELLDLPTRIYNLFRNDKVSTIRELVQKTESSLLARPNFGKTCLLQLKDELARHGLRLGMTDVDMAKLKEAA